MGNLHRRGIHVQALLPEQRPAQGKIFQRDAVHDQPPAGLQPGDGGGQQFGKTPATASHKYGMGIRQSAKSFGGFAEHRVHIAERKSVHIRFHLLPRLPVSFNGKYSKGGGQPRGFQGH
jgi:hypothetical protein